MVHEALKKDAIMDTKGVTHVDVYQKAGVAVGKKSVNTLSPRQNSRHFADSIFKCIFMNENV